MIKKLIMAAFCVALSGCTQGIQYSDYVRLVAVCHSKGMKSQDITMVMVSGAVIVTGVRCLDDHGRVWSPKSIEQWSTNKNNTNGGE